MGKVVAHRGYYVPREVMLQGAAQAYLLELIAQDRRFQKEAERIRQQYPELVGGPWASFPLAGQATARAQEYARAIRELARNLGLRCEWGPEAVHNLVGLPPGTWTTPVAVFSAPDPATIIITVEVEYYPDTTWEDVRRAILAEAKRQFEAARKRIRERYNLGQRDKFPHNLKRDVELLYKRICKGMGDLEIWKELDDELEKEGKAGLTYETVREIISDTARLLGIALR